MEHFFGFVAFLAFIGVVYWLASRRKGGKGGSFNKSRGSNKEN